MIGHGVVDEKARQVEQSREPRHHEDKVKRFDPEHAGDLAESDALSLDTRAQKKPRCPVSLEEKIITWAIDRTSKRWAHIGRIA